MEMYRKALEEEGKRCTDEAEVDRLWAGASDALKLSATTAANAENARRRKATQDFAQELWDAFRETMCKLFPGNCDGTNPVFATNSWMCVATQTCAGGDAS